MSKKYYKYFGPTIDLSHVKFESVWGKPDLDIRCNDCLENFEEVI